MAFCRSRLPCLYPTISETLTFPTKLKQWQLMQSSVRTAFFGKNQEELPDTDEIQIRKINPAFDGPSATSRTTSLKKRTSVRTRKAYKPPDDVEARIKNIASEIFKESAKWKEIKLNDRIQKYKFLTQCIDEFDHNIPNSDLNDMLHILDIVNFFQTPVHDTSSYEDLHKLDLPRNLHIQLEAVRFDPETDTFFDGVTAFPKRPTIVTSIKYRHKYKGNDGNHRKN